MDARKNPDPVASLTLALVAAVALGTSWVLPWWLMEARAPQYGQRTLVIEVNPARVTGDVFEVDGLGHYVGIHPMGSLAPVERRLAPIGMGLALAGVLAAPWLRRRWLRLLAVLPVVAMPLIFLGDLNYWMKRGTHDRDPDAALNLTVTSIDAKLLGRYDLGQFHVTAKASGGLFVAGLAGLLGVGLAFAAPLQRPAFRRRRATLVAVGAGALLLSGPPADAAEREVGPGETLAAAIAAAAPGDALIVPAGVWRERLTVDKRLRIEGRPGAVLDGGGAGTVLRITADGVEVRGLTVRGSGDGFTREDAAIRIDHAAGVRIEGVRVEDALFGLFVAQGDRCVIDRCTIAGKDLPEHRRGDGIRLWYSSGCRVTHNLVERSRDVVVWYSSRTVFEDNLVRRSRYGLHYMYSDDNSFRRNRFEDNLVGATVMNSRGVELTGNAFSFSTGPSGYGLLVKDADDVFITGNRFVGNATALFFDGAPQARGGRVELRKNLIARNDVGVALEPRTRGIVAWDNSFLGNRVQVQLQGTGQGDGNTWSQGGRGNYWSDAVPYDADGDGVSDLPYRPESTFEALADRNAALAFFDGTPGADAIDLGARLFPIFAPREKLVDPHPLVRPPLDAWLRGGPGLGLAGLALLSVAATALYAHRRAAS
jgi:nitrous oxidase accessory protein